MARKSQISPDNGNEWRVFDYDPQVKEAYECNCGSIWKGGRHMCCASMTSWTSNGTGRRHQCRCHCVTPPMFPLQMLPIFGWLLSAHAMSLLLPLLPAPPIAILSLWFFLEDTGLGVKRGGHYWTRTKKMLLARFHIFLKSPMLEKPISFLRKLVSFQKCFQQIAPTDWGCGSTLTFVTLRTWNKSYKQSSNKSYSFLHTWISQ
jgi:hypothetical protein